MLNTLSAVLAVFVVVVAVNIFLYYDVYLPRTTTSPALSSSPPKISALKAEPGTDGSATISWTTDVPSDSRVEYGTSESSPNKSVSDPASTPSHSLKLTGLQADTTYYYRVSSTDADNNTASSPPSGQAPASFQTPPKPTTTDEETTTSTATATATATQSP
jgi:hypothetical protein